MIKGQVCNPVTNTFINMDTINLAIDPYPIEAVEENKINIHFEVEVLKEIAKGVKFEVIVKRKGEILPCIRWVRMTFPKHYSKKLLVIRSQIVIMVLKSSKFSTYRIMDISDLVNMILKI